eukprot:2750616-Amphidinium_carterae.2
MSAGVQHGTGQYKNARGQARRGKWQEGKRLHWLDVQPEGGAGEEATEPEKEQILLQDGEFQPV